MAGLKLISFAVFVAALCVVVSSKDIVGKVLGCPGSPWCPEWVPCNYTEVQGATCLNCETRVICTPVGGLVRPCWLPGHKHCVDGNCVREPSEDCAPPTIEPPTKPEEPVTPTEGPSTTNEVDVSDSPVLSNDV